MQRKDKTVLVLSFPSNMSQPLVFYVNGVKVENASPKPQQSLADYIRNNLKLKGTKIGCNEGICGACTVLVSEQHPVSGKLHHYSANACLLPLCSVHGKAVTTVEGLNKSGELHPIQERLMKTHGTQCGFCSPGFVMSMYALLKNNANPTLKELDLGIQGNLCRCTGYRPILEAFQSLCEQENCCQKKENNKEGCCKDRNKKIDDELTEWSKFKLYDSTQDPIFPPALHTSSLNKEEALFKLENQIWYRPVTLNQLKTFAAQHKDAVFVGGNTILATRDWKEKTVFVDIRNVKELREIAINEGEAKIGAAVSVTELQNAFLKQKDVHNVFPEIAELLNTFGSLQIRNVATVGGNLLGGSSSSILSVVWAALKAKCVYLNENGTLKEAELPHTIEKKSIVVAVKFSVPNKLSQFLFHKYAKKIEFDVSIVCGGIQVDNSGEFLFLRGSFGGIAKSGVVSFQSEREELATYNIKAIGDQGVQEWFGSHLENYGLHKTDYKYQLCLGIVTNAIGRLTNNHEDILNQCRRMRSVQILDENIHNPFKHMGKGIAHRSGDLQVRGTAQFGVDIDVFDCLHLCFVLSEKASAELLSVDTTAALAHPGVYGSIDWRSIPNKGSSVFCLHDDQPVFPKDKVTWVGQPILAILGETQEAAERGAKLVKITYGKDLERVISIDEAIKAKSFIEPTFIVSNHRGPDKKILEDLDWDPNLKTVSGHLYIGGQKHYYLEPQNTIAIPRENDELSLISSCQDVTWVQKEVSKVLGLPCHKISVEVRRVGGAFGGKVFAAAWVAVPVALAAHIFKRPVRCTLKRWQDMAITGPRQSALGQYTVSVDNEGHFHSLKADIYNQCGIGAEISNEVIIRNLLHVDNSYYIPQILARGHRLRTNTPTATPFRALGAPQAQLLMESVVEKVADELDLDPQHVKELNLEADGRVNYPFRALHPTNVRQCWDACKELANYERKTKDMQEFNRTHKDTKRGIAMMPTRYGQAHGPLVEFNEQGMALVNIYTDGSVLVHHAGIELGQGIHTKMAQIAADVLEIPLEKVYTKGTGSDTVANGVGTHASRGTDVNSMAVKDACQKLKSRLEPFKKLNPEAPWEKVVGTAYMNRVNLSANGFHKADLDPFFNFETGEGRPYEYFVFGASFAEVEIDCRSGHHKLLSAAVVMDIGNTLNPAIDVGQVEGAFLQGYGLCTIEDLTYNNEGKLGPYRIPTPGEAPRHFRVRLLQPPDTDRVAYGAKGIGEPPVALGTVVWSAIRSAIRGARKSTGRGRFFYLDSPATPEAVSAACRSI